jgi:hypothetical protein
MTSEAEAGLVEAVARAVRQASRELRLATQAEVLAMVLATAASTPSDREEHVGADAAAQPSPAVVSQEELGSMDSQELEPLLGGILASHPGLAAFESVTGQTVYYAPDLLSRTYARILDRKGSPLTLMAGEIRSNSRDYPRPVPVELFGAQPFGLTPEDIGQSLQAMAASPDYQDIASTTTSAGTVFLFSTLHLEPGYAKFLAQRAESLVQNP